MTLHRTINLTLAGLIALALSTSYLLDGPDDHSHEMAQAADMSQAIKQEAAAHRYRLAVSKLCGDNAGYVEQADGTVACTTKKGRKTGHTVQVAGGV
jgi:hypothetical protein